MSGALFLSRPFALKGSHTVVRHKNISRGGLTYEAINFTSSLFPDLEIHATKRFIVVTQEGHGDVAFMKAINLLHQTMCAVSPYRFFL